MVFYEELGNDKNAIHSILVDIYFVLPNWNQNYTMVSKPEDFTKNPYL